MEKQSLVRAFIQAAEGQGINNDTPADAMQLKPCPFCQREAIWRPMTEECGVPFGVNVQHTSDCWLNYEKTGRAPFDDLPVRWNTRTTSLAAQDVPIRLRYEYAKGSTIEDMRSNLSEQLRNAGDCKLMWVNEGDLGIVEMMAASPAPSLAAQDGLVEALELLLGYVRKSRQGYVLVPLADRIAEVTAEHALAVAKGQDCYATLIAEQLKALHEESRKQIEQSNAALASIEVKSERPMSTRLHPDNPFGNGGWE